LHETLERDDRPCSHVPPHFSEIANATRRSSAAARQKDRSPREVLAMKLGKPFDVRACRIFRCALVLTFTLAVFHETSAATPAALAVVSGGGQIATLDDVFPQAISARLADAAGAPVAGVEVQFQVDQCITIAVIGAPPCPPEDAYPYFGDHQNAVVVTTDENGVATTPALTAGSEVGSYRVVASQYSDVIGGGVLHAYFALWQVSGAVGVPITSGFTGAWYDPAQSGHGLLVEVLPNDVLLAYWFAFTPDGSQQAWFGGTGPILGNQAIVQAGQGTGGRWIPDFDPADYALNAWGTLTFTFTDCDHGRVDFASDINSPPWGWNSMALTRLTHPAGLECSTPAEH
jgi:hypothetical protein